ncbi:primosomal protein DnaI [Tenuibacillus multivorans]|uniref:Primosomal protein DnaI n=1 Tax=Tenuibacillus multivorans TaxID=237069 RepID=A0A1G9ZT58_9BACI|nr:primosomal protein DnaI [Tenuibacillus multivorans]GEL76830.1 primosomal protein DnaI [Tenuibacillus multivorans]SDN24111.1 primosomal protein DnaI [Tenuibacillus multivorans]
MESIQTTLNNWLKGKESYQKSMKQMRDQVLSSPEIKDFLIRHPEITDDQLDKQLIKLYEYNTQSKACEKCPSLEQCCNVISGYAPEIRYENDHIKLSYHECPNKEKHLEELEKRNFVQSLHMPKEIHEARFNDLYLNETGRVKVHQEVKKFLDKSQDKIPSKGLYLYGKFGVGKTFILGALANALAERKIDTYFIYMPELVREMKASINDSSINTKIDRFKNASVLVLDDIGAEFSSAWFRDEVLGAILQYRMMERLPVFFTSNYAPDELESILSKSGKGEYEQLKAARIMERIRQISEPVEVIGENYRD